MRKKGFVIVLISLILFLILPLKAGAETSISYNDNSILEVVSDVSDNNNLITNSSSVTEDTVYEKKDRCPPTGEKEQKDKINDILLTLVLLIVVTAIAVISKFLSDENHRDDNK